MKAMLSITGLYAFDNNIFSKLHLPSGVDRDMIISKIMIDCAELSLIYTEPVTVKMMIDNWSRINVDNWARIYKALSAEYDPITNYDRHEKWTDTGSSSNETRETGTTQQSTGTTRKVAGWNNDSSLTPAEGVDSSGTGSAANTTAGTGSTSNVREGRAYGNIGVTTNQQMITEEINLRVNSNIADIISRSFKQNFCLMVY